MSFDRTLLSQDDKRGNKDLENDIKMERMCRSLSNPKMMHEHYSTNAIRGMPRNNFVQTEAALTLSLESAC